MITWTVRALLGIIVGCALLLLTGCGTHFIRKGYAPYCMVYYEEKVIDCKYATMNDCRNAYGTSSGARVCFPSRDTH